MAYRDTQLRCATCGQTFLWTIEEQRQAEEAGQPLVPPEYCREHRPAEPLAPYGRVKWFSAEKGYGFIVEPNGQEIFFHRSGLAAGVEPAFNDGDKVTYEVQYGAKGPQAVNVAPYAEPAPT
jgi:CspA family cold shock protein